MSRQVIRIVFLLVAAAALAVYVRGRRAAAHTLPFLANAPKPPVTPAAEEPLAAAPAPAAKPFVPEIVATEPMWVRPTFPEPVLAEEPVPAGEPLVEEPVHVPAGEPLLAEEPRRRSPSTSPQGSPSSPGASRRGARPRRGACRRRRSLSPSKEPLAVEPVHVPPRGASRRAGARPRGGASSRRSPSPQGSPSSRRSLPPSTRSPGLPGPLGPYTSAAVDPVPVVAPAEQAEASEARRPPAVRGRRAGAPPRKEPPVAEPAPAPSAPNQT